MSKRAEAGEILNRGGQEQTAGRLDGALSLYLQATEIDPTYASAWYNAALIYKWRHEWASALTCSIQAADHDSSNDASILWNLGIAASALGSWTHALRAWKGLGIPIETGDDGSPRLNIGVTPIRLLSADGSGEVVWADRFDPVRARILNIPTPESGHRWWDVVLHDAEPKGKRERDGQFLSVFNALERLVPSSAATWAVDLEAPAPEDVEALVQTFHESDDHAQDWSDSLEIICKACSEGTPHEHSPAPARVWTLKRSFGIATEAPGRAEEILSSWAQGASGRRWADLRQVL